MDWVEELDYTSDMVMTQYVDILAGLALAARVRLAPGWHGVAEGSCLCGTDLAVYVHE